MNRRIVRSELVLSDFDELSEYIRQRNPRAASPKKLMARARHR